MRIAPDLDRTPTGPSIAPLAVAGFALTDAAWGTGIGPLATAAAVTRLRVPLPLDRGYTGARWPRILRNASTAS